MIIIVIIIKNKNQLNRIKPIDKYFNMLLNQLIVHDAAFFSNRNKLYCTKLKNYNNFSEIYTQFINYSTQFGHLKIFTEVVTGGYQLNP